jgi:hypothetical protein
VRDWLASTSDERIPEIVAKWSQIEEFAPADLDSAQLHAMVVDLVDLARRARMAGDELYCWCCL